MKKDILIQAWDYCYDVEGWYPPLRNALEEVDGSQAIWRPEGEASNTIREIVNHLFYYKRRFLFRLEEKTWPYKITSNDQTFWPGEHTMQLTWDKLVEELASVHGQIRAKISALADDKLDSKLPDDTIGQQIMILATHDAYHTGQIILIRKLYGSWPGARET
jgi:uncharacterized damage-inducible protein DinB